MNQFTILLFKEQGQWIAQGLEHDITAQAETMLGVVSAFEHTLASEFAICTKKGLNFHEAIPPAPKYYWNKLNK